MNAKILFENLVNVYAKKLERERLEKIKEKKREIKEEIKKEEKVEKAKPLVRTFPPSLPLPSPLPPPLPKPTQIEKISAKELEIRPKTLKASVIEEIPKKIEVEKKVTFDFGKLTPIVYNNVRVIEVMENEKAVVEYRDGRKEIRDVKLSREEIEDLIKRIAERTRLPISEIFEAYFENFFIHAELKERFRFTLIKIV